MMASSLLFSTVSSFIHLSMGGRRIRLHILWRFNYFILRNLVNFQPLTFVQTFKKINTIVSSIIWQNFDIYFFQNHSLSLISYRHLIFSVLLTYVEARAWGVSRSVAILGSFCPKSAQSGNTARTSSLSRINVSQWDQLKIYKYIHTIWTGFEKKKPGYFDKHHHITTSPHKHYLVLPCI